MFKYDIPYPKPGELALTSNGIPINTSKRKSYLLEKMKAHRRLMCEDSGLWPAAEYTIIDSDGNLVYRKNFIEGEKVATKAPYSKVRKDKTNYVSKDGFEFIADQDGNIITDEELAAFFYDFIYVKRLPIHNSRQVSVQLATYMPTTKDEFIALKGLGERIYAKCGETLLDAIKTYLELE